MTAARSLPIWLRPLEQAARGGGLSGWLTFAPPAGTGRPSAVLALFGEGPQGPDLLFIERSASLRAHPGQPAFPGGRIEDSDVDAAAAALREAEEETGLDPNGVVVFACLPALWLPPSGYAVTPVLAWWQHPVAVHAVDPGEVARVERVSIADLAAPVNRLQAGYPGGLVGPAFAVADLLIWGFTGRLVDALLKLGGWEQPWDHSRVRLLTR
ncbi:MAG: NUDIX hydrolase [Mycobacteriales bacterium]